MTVSVFSGETKECFNDDLLKEFTYRNLGPFRSGSWISDFAVPEFPEEAHLYTFYVAGRNGGLWKTTNNGTTFKSLFDDQDIFSIGDVTLAPSDPSTVWVGTGEHTTARSSYWGDGVYKSTDEGETWIHMGLKETQHIGRIGLDIYRKNPAILYAVVENCSTRPPTDVEFEQDRRLGREPQEREIGGEVYRTDDAGEPWTKMNSKVFPSMSFNTRSRV